MYKLFTLALAMVCAVNAWAQNQSIYLNNQTIEKTEQVSASELYRQLMSLPVMGNHHYGIVQFNTMPNQDEIKSLSANGIQLLDYMPSNAYYARILAGSDLNQLNHVRSIIALAAKHRLQEDLLLAPYPDHAIEGNQIELNVICIDPNDQGLLIQHVEEFGGEVLAIDKHAETVKLNLLLDNLSALADLPFIQFIEPKDAPGLPENYKGRSSHRIESLKKVYTGLPNEMNGKGVHVMLQDDGVIGPHIDYTGRIGGQFISSNNGDHGDHTGGTIMAAGNLNPRYAGMAPASTIYVYGAASQGYPGFDSIYNHYNDYDIRITSTSYSNGVNAGYTTLARKLDEQVEQMSDLIHVFSAGNAGSGWNTITGGHKVAKNVITVANLTYEDNANSSSSRGPTRTGRIKPDIGAVGTNVWSTSNDHRYVQKTGTSMSCPGVAGVVTVLSQAYKQFNGGQNPEIALMKGVLCNTADDIGNPGPDFTNGFGRVNARKAYEAIKNQTYFMDSVSNTGSKTIQITVPSQTTLLKVMLIWADPKGTVGSSRPLVNDLDIELSSQTIPSLLPLILNSNSPAQVASNGRDSINNLEQVVLKNPTAGSYSIKVSGTSVPQGPQKFYVVYCMEGEGVTLEYPVGDESMVPGETETIRWSSPDGTAPFNLEYSLNNGSSWTPLASVQGNDGYYDWTVPNVASAQAKIRITSINSTHESGEFNIFGAPSKPFLGRSCPDSSQLRWNPISGTDYYVIYKLGEMYMDSIATSTSTVFELKGKCIGYEEGWYAVSAVGVNGERGRRSEAYEKTGQLFNCIMDKDVEIVSLNPNIDFVKECLNPNGVPLEVELENIGTQFSDPFDLHVTVNGSALQTINHTTPILPGTSIDLKFPQNLTFTVGSNDVAIWMSSISDENTCNDTNRVEADYSDLPALKSCDLSDFESFNNCGTSSNCAEEICDLQDGWINDKNGIGDDIDWRVHNGSTPTGSTGPARDHTTNTPLGKYLYLESSGGCTSQFAHLLSHCYDLSGTNTPELSFWYHMYGSTMGNLRVDIYVDGAWKNNIGPVLSGNKGNQWHNSKIDLALYKGKVVQFRFVGETGSNFRSDMALDDIMVIDDVKADYNHVAASRVVDFTNTSTGSKTYSWNFGDGNTSTNESPQHTYALDGTYTVQLIIDGDCGTDTISKEVTVLAESIHELLSQAQVSVYPQPAKDNIIIESDLNIEQLKIYDLSGKSILSLQEETKALNIDVSDLKSGLYILELKVEDGTIRQKIEILE